MTKSNPRFPSSFNTSQLQTQIDEATNVMKNNLMASLERGKRLDELEECTENLSFQTQLFKGSAHKVRKRMCFAEMKQRSWLYGGILILIVLIGGTIATVIKVLSK